MSNFLQQITPEVLAVALGFAIRHLLMPYFSGKETSTMIKYLKEHQETAEQRAELRYQLAEARYWSEVHANSCPYVKNDIREAKELFDHLTKGKKNENFY